MDSMTKAEAREILQAHRGATEDELVTSYFNIARQIPPNATFLLSSKDETERKRQQQFVKLTCALVRLLVHHSNQFPRPSMEKMLAIFNEISFRKALQAPDPQKAMLASQNAAELLAEEERNKQKEEQLRRKAERKRAKKKRRSERKKQQQSTNNGNEKTEDTAEAAGASHTFKDTSSADDSRSDSCGAEEEELDPMSSFVCKIALQKNISISSPRVAGTSAAEARDLDELLSCEQGRALQLHRDPQSSEHIRSATPDNGRTNFCYDSSALRDSSACDASSNAETFADCCAVGSMKSVLSLLPSSISAEGCCPSAVPSSSSSDLLAVMLDNSSDISKLPSGISSPLLSSACSVASRDKPLSSTATNNSSDISKSPSGISSSLLSSACSVASRDKPLSSATPISAESYLSPLAPEFVPSSGSPDMSLRDASHERRVASEWIGANESMTKETQVGSLQIGYYGNYLAVGGYFDIAIAKYTQGLLLNPSDYRFLGNRSLCYERLMRFEEALNDADEAIRVCAGYVKGHFRRGKALVGLKRLREAMQAFDQALTLDPSDADIRAELEGVCTSLLIAQGYSAVKAKTVLSGQDASLRETVEALLAENMLDGRRDPDRTLMVEDERLTGSCSEDSNRGAEQSIMNQTARRCSFDEGDTSDVTSLWIGNLYEPVKEKKLMKLFSRYGSVASVHTRPEMFCAFVNFWQREAAEKAIEGLQNHQVGKNKLLVRFSDRSI